MKKPLRILTVLFGPIGDSLMTLALFDDILSVRPDATFLIITRRNAGIIRDLAHSYPQIEVRQIPGGLRSVPFFLSLLMKQWTLLAVGVALHYSFQLKCFFFALSILPGNRTIGLDDRLEGEKHWLPLDIPVKPQDTWMIKNLRLMLLSVPSFDKAAVEELMTRAPHVVLNSTVPKDFQLKKKQYIVVHLLGMAEYRSLPPRRWKSVLAQVAREYPQFPLVFTGASKDRTVVEDVARSVPRSQVCIDLPILDVAGIINNAALYIGVDTGISHLAGVLQQKSVIVSHLGDTRWVILYNPHARILFNSRHCKCPTDDCYIKESDISYRHCIYDLTDEIILASTRLALSSPESSIPGFAGLIDENLQ